MTPKILKTLKFTVEEFKKSGLESYCRKCPKTNCDGWRKILVQVDGHLVASWKCEHHTVMV